ncbi:Ca2+-binding RTX toxin-like protein [Pararhizobium capsulatum DSM 1112]|uniref:Ca2+-binding RTX toxin-like protein n=1 Tax=Pararhizobium capsulatum DSM 1112 TaxID=1121113 RepID=A0ABU0BVM9_9HYPH|nr:calcium-binding protein [Pararhizobium capsulatum]MDQ0322317.1 Ca2+-binding RTX toxin-like protein [Pararhizobium capsulatum DSM 1112]
MTSFTVTAGTTQTTRIDMSGSDDVTVQATGSLSVSANAQSIRFQASTDGALITNSGTIENTNGGGRAIRFETGVGASLTAIIDNAGTIQAVDDAIQIQAGSVTSGTLTISNSAAGTIQSTTGQALDLAGGTGAFVADVTNAGNIFALVNDAIRFGGVGTLINSGDVDGGTAATYEGSDGVQFEDNATGTVQNDSGGSISGDRHAINGGVGSFVTVVNNATGIINGRNGSGVGLDGDGTVTNFGTISGNFSDSAGSDTSGLTPGGPDGINDGDGDGIDIDGQATIENYGTIRGTGAGGHGSDGLPNTSEGIAAGGGTFTNFAGALITGLGLGILIDDSSQGNAPFLTTIINNGIISGTNSVGIRIISVLADTITNNGMISGGGGTAIRFGDGNNTLVIGASSTINGLTDGEGGTNTLDYSTFGSGAAINLLTGAATGTGGVGNFQNVIGSAGVDNITGNAGANRIDGKGGADTMSGGSGNDTYIVDNAGDVVVESSTDGTSDKVATRVSYALSTSAYIEQLSTTSSTGTTAINLTGNSIAQAITGNAGANKIDGKGGADTMTGGGSSDTYYVDNAGDVVVESSTGGTSDWVATSVSYALSPSAYVEKLSTTSSSGTTAINLTGNGIAQTITGNAGANKIDGKAGADTMSGIDGNDIYYVDNAGDVVIEKSTDGTSDKVATNVSYALSSSAYVEKLSTTTISGTTAINLTGNGIAQTITGNAGANKIDGKGGADTMSGGAGNDTYTVDNAGDIVVESSNGGTSDWVATSVSYALSSFAYVEKLSTTSSAGTTAINLTGNDFIQTITGNAGANIINGRSGNDTLSGGAGSDTFLFNSGLNSTTNFDKITDYNVAADTIRLENAVFTALAAVGTLASGAFASNATGLAGDSDDRIIYEKDTGELYYDANGNKAGGGIHFATLSANLSLTNADFFVV